jgi:hypothetical protein
MVSRRRNKPKESTNVLIKLKISVPIEDNEDDAVGDAIDDVYGMDWNEEDDYNNSSRDKF